MTEQEFWRFLERSWKKGRVSQVSVIIDSPDSQMQALGKCLQGHSLLPRDYDKIPEGEISKISELLFVKGVRLKTKEAVMMILAHQGSKKALNALKNYNILPDNGLEIFAELALSECEMWNKDGQD